jgi:hypothetical protein
MKCYETYAQLELIPVEEAQKVLAPSPNGTAQQRFANLVKLFQRMAENALSFLSGSSDPRIDQWRDTTGKLHYRVYDPTIGQTLHFHSEAEVRSWLDQRYYQ